MMLTPVRRFCGNKEGATSIIFGLVAVMLCGIVGAAVDYTRWSQARRITQAALDSAVLSGARVLLVDPTDATAAVAAATNFYNHNVAGRAPLLTDTIQFQVTDSNSAISATGDAYMGTTLLNVIGITQMKVASSTGAGFPKATISGGAGSNIEVSLMLDVTGSMCDGSSPCTTGTKITGMKDAAKSLIDIVVRDDQSQHYSKVAIVPFAARIRVGPDGGGTGMMTALTDLPTTWTGWQQTCLSGTSSGDSENASWHCDTTAAQHYVDYNVKPCVTDRYRVDTGYDYTDALPGSGLWLNAHDGSRRSVSLDSSDTAMTAGQGTGQTALTADLSEQWNYDAVGECSDMPESNELMPLSANKTALKARIDALQAVGSTGGALGTAFSWYMLSPNWSTIWTGAAAPGSYSDVTTNQASGAPVLRKVAVLMTDGAYNTQRGWKNQNQQTVSNHAKTLCTNMKAQGIEIYTVGFALDQLSIAERAIALDMLQSCGSSVEHFYETLNVAQLNTAFQDIGIKMTSISLSR